MQTSPVLAFARIYAGHLVAIAILVCFVAAMLRLAGVSITPLAAFCLPLWGAIIVATGGFSF